MMMLNVCGLTQSRTYTSDSRSKASVMHAHYSNKTEGVIKQVFLKSSFQSLFIGGVTSSASIQIKVCIESLLHLHHRFKNCRCFEIFFSRYVDVSFPNFL